MTDNQGLDGNADSPPIFNVGFRLSGWELAGWELVKAVHSEPAGTIYLWQQGAALARLVVAELPSRSAANERLGAELAHTMRPDIPSAGMISPNWARQSTGARMATACRAWWPSCVATTSLVSFEGRTSRSMPPR